jgi:carboxymethylenebutenolidase
MIEQDVMVPTRHGAMPSFAVCPSGAGPYPGIIVYMDAPGIREELRNIARRIARHGYFCVLPDMYYRIGQIRFDLPRRNEAMTEVVRACLRHLNNDFVMDDTAGLLGFLDAQDKVKQGPVGGLGYCMSGRYVTVAAARFPHRIVAAGSLYGVGMATEDDGSPHKLVDRVKGELYFGFAEVDGAAPPETIAALKAALDKAGTRYKLEVYPNTRHGYGFPNNAAYETIASEQSWECLFDMWDRNLK